MSPILEITDDQFETEVLQAEGLVLAYFWAPWCGPCRLVAPSVQKMAETYDEKLKVVKIEVDPNPETVAKYKVEGIPVLLVFREGEVLEKSNGAIGKQRLEEMITNHL
jgi:thioredoxin 1